MFIAGQRWICDSELSLGLGTVLKSDFRTVTIVFLASGETRTYSQQTAPLRRAAFNIGDTIESHEGWQLKITAASETDGLITYEGTNESNGQTCTLDEGHLSNNIQLNRPYDRLFSGQIDKAKWFNLRSECRTHHKRLANSDLTGLYDARTSLVPHQLYIAHEVAKRFAPRVLLADEVGLGKTIEACMIMQHQLITGRASRVLIIVPEALMHQWLVELMRRFNLTFSVFDKDRCEAILESTDFENPFHAEQLVLCNLGFLKQNPEHLEQAIEGNWDLVIVDEAHHLQWSEEKPSAEYQAIEAISQKSKGLLLLTATPEQLGKASHFARLRLLDPQRFHDFQAFISDESAYQDTAATIEAILDDKPLETAQRDMLASLLNDDSLTNNSEIDEEKKQSIIEQLLDRHGTGRVLFRNTRHTIKGFPERKAILTPLTAPAQYSENNELATHMELNEPELLIAPERLHQIISNIKSELGGNTKPKDWWTFDTRVEFLIDLLNKYKSEKILVICASSHTAQDLESAIRIKTGKRVSAFHEELSIIERDRAASYFADDIDGAHALICSEIGSEGRNFQFAHHLVLFDLPLNPDLLEQRIGRLDRIGQTENIQIHVPYFENTAQQVLAHWYMNGLNAFEKTCQVGEAIYRKIEPALLELLQDPQYQKSSLDSLIDSTQSLLSEYLEALQKGRDRLLELNSYKSDIALGLQKQIADTDANPELQDFMEQVFATFDVDSEIYRSGSFIIKPGQHMHESVFHGLNEDGTAITFDRNIALSNEDMQFITWNHPFTRDAIDTVLSNEKGNTALSAIKTRQFTPGTLMIETYFSIECIFPEAKKAGLPVNFDVLHSIVTATGVTLTDTQIKNLYKAEVSSVDKKTSHKIIKSQLNELKALMSKASAIADDELPKVIKRNQQTLSKKVQDELNRLEALKHVNPSIREDEIEHQQNLLNIINDRLSSSKVRLDAVRVIITH